jgi:hypothetical protein
MIRVQGGRNRLRPLACWTQASRLKRSAAASRSMDVAGSTGRVLLTAQSAKESEHMASGTPAFLFVLSVAIIPPAVAAPPVVLGAEQEPASRASGARPEEIVEIDGSKNPELIPQWAAWEFAFRVMGGGPRELPTTVYRVVSKEERALILAEAQASLQRDKACQQRVEKLLPLVGKEKNSVVNAKQQEIQLDCRRETLHARDRLLERLRPEGQAELIAFVEDTKGGTRVTIPKRELAHYLQPQ